MSSNNEILIKKGFILGRIFNKKYFFIFLLIWCGFFQAWGKTCPDGTYPVKAHLRMGYYKNDGTYISPTKVSMHCRKYRNHELSKLAFKNKKHPRWPHKKETFITWKKKEKLKIQEYFSELPSVLTKLGEISFYRSKKSRTYGNPAALLRNARYV